MANCGHVACIKCWDEWLIRSPTCPTCREKTLKKDLTKIAYEDESSVGVPTLTQICASDEEDGDETLEIIRKIPCKASETDKIHEPKVLFD